ncbi:hypothetical protein [Phaeovulum veldkampii]|uniref:hypothetical protein n=1 Tax=Phaeovulum veldkampii TaxID=33049 RepID=UPI0014560D91|nr:hypothetical protein [Phaeovulum veldkampii]
MSGGSCPGRAGMSCPRCALAGNRIGEATFKPASRTESLRPEALTRIKTGFAA